MKIKDVDTVYDERGQRLKDVNLIDLVNGDSVWVRNSSRDKRTADDQKIHLVVIGPPTVGKSGFSFFFFLFFSFFFFAPNHSNFFFFAVVL